MTEDFIVFIYPIVVGSIIGLFISLIGIIAKQIYLLWMVLKEKQEKKEIAKYIYEKTCIEKAIENENAFLKKYEEYRKNI